MEVVAVANKTKFLLLRVVFLLLVLINVGCFTVVAVTPTPVPPSRSPLTREEAGVGVTCLIVLFALTIGAIALMVLFHDYYGPREQ